MSATVVKRCYPRERERRKNKRHGRGAGWPRPCRRWGLLPARSSRSGSCGLKRVRLTRRINQILHRLRTHGPGRHVCRFQRNQNVNVRAQPLFRSSPAPKRGRCALAVSGRFRRKIRWTLRRSALYSQNEHDSDSLKGSIVTQFAGIRRMGRMILFVGLAVVFEQGGG